MVVTWNKSHPSIFAPVKEATEMIPHLETDEKG